MRRIYDLFNRVGRGGRWLTLAGLACGAGFLTALWMGLLLAEAGHFSAWIALLMAVVAGGFAWRHFRRRQDEGAASKAKPLGLLAAGALALLSFAFTVPPSEVILGGWDPGVYVHTAAVLAHDGSLRPECPDLVVLDADSRALIGRQGHDAWAPFLGMRMMPDGHLSPQFYHLYPVLLALVWPLGGVRAALMVNPLLNAICIVALYLWACRWVKPRWAFAAALVLALNPAQVWQAGFATSEMLAQCLLLVGLLAMDRALSSRTKDRMDAIVAGAAFGLMMLARYDALLFVVPFALVLLTGLRDKSQRGQLIVLLGTTAALSVQLWFHQHYLAPLYHPMGNLVAPGLLAAGILALLIAVAVVFKPRRTEDNVPAANRQLKLQVAAVVGLVAWVFLYWYVRPRLTMDGRVLGFVTWLYPHLKDATWFPIIAGRNAKNFWYLQSLFGTAGLLVALAGIGVLIVRTRTTWRTAWLVASLGVLALLMTLISHEPFMMFVSRRLVPVIIPLLCLGVAALCDRFEWVLRARPRRGAVAAWLVLGLTLSGTFGGTLFMAGHREWPGLANWYDQLAARIPRGALVYSDAPGFAAPLRFMYGIQACEVRAISPGRRTDPMIMMMKKAEHNAVFWLTQSNVPAAYTEHATPMASLPLHSVILGTAHHTVPRYVRARGGMFTLYRITPRDGPPDA